MEALRNSLAQLVVLEARAHDVVDPGAMPGAVKAVVKELAIALEAQDARIVALEEQLAALSDVGASKGVAQEFASAHDSGTKHRKSRVTL